MRILQYLKWMRRRDGGVVNTVSLLCPMLASLGHQVTLLTCEDGELPASHWHKLSELGVPGRALRAGDVRTWAPHATKPTVVRVELSDPLARLRGRHPLQSERDEPTQVLGPGAMAIARAILPRHDVLALHGPWATSNWQLARLARSLGVPYVISPHGMLDAWVMAQGARKKRLHLALLSRRMLDRARCVHCEMRAEVRHVRRHTSAPIVVGPPPPIDPRAFEPLPGKRLAMERFDALRAARERGASVVGFLGRLNPKKGPDKLIRAAEAWKARGLAIDVLLGGLGHPPEYETSLRELARARGVDDRVHFLGLVTGDEKWSLLEAIDLLALPTSQENFGIVLVEALLCGTPVLTTTGVDIWPELKESGGATIIDVDETQLIESVPRILADTAMRDAMGRAGRSWARQRLEPDALARGYARMLAGDAPIEPA